ncbi:alpha/beta fold hydrolase [Nocardia fusca]|uniref:alpha/beta fold hydrolase n=1 Tax=Nocardia fusca TaxID=941183 RepID=UPI00350E4134
MSASRESVLDIQTGTARKGNRSGHTEGRFTTVAEFEVDLLRIAPRGHGRGRGERQAARRTAQAVGASAVPPFIRAPLGASRYRNRPAPGVADPSPVPIKSCGWRLRWAQCRLVLGTEVRVRVAGGVLSGVDFGGEGTGVLLVHGSGHNCAAWSEVASYLVAHCRAVAFDLRGHGHTEADSRTPEQYWRDLGEVVAALGWDRPVLVGHSTGGYAVTAATAAGVVDPAALCLVDGLVLDDRATAIRGNAQWREPEAAQQLREMFVTDGAPTNAGCSTQPADDPARRPRGDHRRPGTPGHHCHRTTETGKAHR